MSKQQIDIDEINLYFDTVKRILTKRLNIDEHLKKHQQAGKKENGKKITIDRSIKSTIEK